MNAKETANTRAISSVGKRRSHHDAKYTGRVSRYSQNRALFRQDSYIQNYHWKNLVRRTIRTRSPTVHQTLARVIDNV